MPFLETPHARFHYETAGSGRTVAMLLHGNFATARWWLPVLERPPRGFTIVTPTLRGFGASTGARVTSIDAHAEDIRMLARSLGLRRFHLVGHSLGGAVALQYALSWPETLRGLGLVAPAPGEAPPDLVAVPRAAVAIGMHWSRFLGTYRPTIANALARMMPGADPATIDFSALLADATAIDDRVLLDVYEALRRWDVRARLPSLGVRVRILAGRRDTLIPVAALEALARTLPRGELDVWDDVGHSPQLERPAEFVGWLERARPRRFAWLRAMWRRLRAWFSGRSRPR